MNFAKENGSQKKFREEVLMACPVQAQPVTRDRRVEVS